MRFLAVLIGVVLLIAAAGAGWLRYREVTLDDVQAIAAGEGVKITARADYSRISAGALVTAYQRIDTWPCDRRDLGTMNEEPGVGSKSARDYFMSGEAPRRDVPLAWSSDLRFVAMSGGDHGLAITNDGRQATRTGGLCARLRGFDRFGMPIGSNTVRIPIPASSITAAG